MRPINALISCSVLFGSHATPLGLETSYANDLRSNILWVPALVLGESHASACQRVRAYPVPNSYYLKWNETTMKNVAIGLGCANSKDLKLNIKGCCSSTMWFDKTSGECFTHSNGPEYVNYGWFHESYSPIYTCLLRTEVASTVNVTINMLSFEKGLLTISGSNFGDIEDDVAVNVGSEICRNVEICTNVCRSCARNPCEPGSICLNVASSPRCFMYCAGKDDRSCPCNTFCDTVNVYSGYTGVESTINLCTPIAFMSGTKGVCPSSYSNDVLQCESPTVDENIEYAISFPISVAVEANVAIHSDDSIAGSLSGWCAQGQDCHDGNICTQDSCVNGRCTYDTVYGCQTTLQTIRERTAPYTFTSYAQANQQNQQANFAHLMNMLGSPSSISQNDDYPIEFHRLPFFISFFGNVVNQIALNPNAVIHLPPIPECTSSYITVQVSVCELFSSMEQCKRPNRNSRCDTLLFSYSPFSASATRQNLISCPSGAPTGTWLIALTFRSSICHKTATPTSLARDCTVTLFMCFFRTFIDISQCPSMPTMLTAPIPFRCQFTATAPCA